MDDGKILNENYAYSRNQPLTGEIILKKIEMYSKLNTEREREDNLQTAYAYADYQPSRPPTEKEEQEWKGVL